MTQIARKTLSGFCCFLHMAPRAGVHPSLTVTARQQELVVGECNSLEPGIPESQGINYSSSNPSAAFPHDGCISAIKFFSPLALSKSYKQLEFVQDKIN